MWVCKTKRQRIRDRIFDNSKRMGSINSKWAVVVSIDSKRVTCVCDQPIRHIRDRLTLCHVLAGVCLRLIFPCDVTTSVRSILSGVGKRQVCPTHIIVPICGVVSSVHKWIFSVALNTHLPNWLDIFPIGSLPRQCYKRSENSAHICRC